MAPSDIPRPPSRPPQRAEREFKDFEEVKEDDDLYGPPKPPPPFSKLIGTQDVRTLNEIQNQHEQAVMFLAYFYDLACMPEELHASTALYLDLIEDVRDAMKLVIATFCESNDYSWFMDKVPRRREYTGKDGFENKQFWFGGINFDPTTAMKMNKNNAHFFSTLFFDLCSILDRLTMPSAFRVQAVKLSRNRAMDDLDGNDPEWDVAKKSSSEYFMPYYGPLGRGFTEKRCTPGWVDKWKTKTNNEEQRKLVDDMFSDFGVNWLKLRTIGIRFNNKRELWLKRADIDKCMKLKMAEFKHWSKLAYKHPHEANPRVEMHKINQYRTLTFCLATEAEDRKNADDEAEEDEDDTQHELKQMAQAFRDWTAVHGVPSDIYDLPDVLDDAQGISDDSPDDEPDLVIPDDP